MRRDADVGSAPWFPRALLLSGSGRYADPWHPFAATSARVADVLSDAGIDITVSDDVDRALAGLVSSAPDLLVVNIGGADEPYPDGVEIPAADPAVDAASRAGLLAHVAAGRALQVLHVSSTSLRFVPEWESILGGIWVRGTTMHPDYGRARIRVETDAHPIVAGIRDFELDDERYSYLRVDPSIERLAWHEHDGLRHPLLWARASGRARVVYDALGHDAASYDSPERCAILANSARWLLEG